MDVKSLIEQETLSPEPVLLAELTPLLEEQMRLEDKVKELEDLVKVTKLQLRGVSNDVIPRKMQQIGIDRVTLSNGAIVEVVDHYYASVSKKDEVSAEEAFAWLVANGHADLIKNQVTLNFTKGQAKEVEEVCAVLEELGYTPDVGLSIHHQTLKAFIKEQLIAGRDVPLETFKAGVEQVTKIKRVS